MAIPAFCEGSASHKIRCQLLPTAREQTQSQVQASWAQRLHQYLINSLTLFAGLPKSYNTSCKNLAKTFTTVVVFQCHLREELYPSPNVSLLDSMGANNFKAWDFFTSKINWFSTLFSFFFLFCEVFIHTVALVDSTSKTLLVIATMAQPEVQSCPNGLDVLYRELYNHWKAPILNDCSLVLKDSSE